MFDPISRLILGRNLAALQAPLHDGFAFDPIPLFNGGFSSAEVGISRRDTAQALVIALMVAISRRHAILTA